MKGRLLVSKLESAHSFRYLTSHLLLNPLNLNLGQSVSLTGLLDVLSPSCLSSRDIRCCWCHWWYFCLSLPFVKKQCDVRVKSTDLLSTCLGSILCSAFGWLGKAITRCHLIISLSIKVKLLNLDEVTKYWDHRWWDNYHEVGG